MRPYSSLPQKMIDIFSCGAREALNKRCQAYLLRFEEFALEEKRKNGIEKGIFEFYIGAAFGTGGDYLAENDGGIYSL